MRAGFSLLEKDVTNKKRNQYKMTPGVLVWNHRYQYKSMVFNIYTEREKEKDMRG